MMKLLSSLVILPALILFTLLGAPPGAAAARPNILLLFADDQRADTLAAWGNPVARTPNMDSLVARGVSFRANYCFGSNSGAVCIPSRAMLHTGRNWLRGDNQMKGAVTLGELLGREGYQTFGTGKWHNGEESWLRSFQAGKNIFFGGMADHTAVPLRDLQPDGRLSPVRRPGGFSSEHFAGAAVDFLKERRDDRPFFAYVAFTAPHDTRNPPEKYREEYYRRRPPLPANFMPQHPFNNGHLVLRDENLAPWPRPAGMISDQLAEYYGLISHLDEQIGRVLAALKESGQDKNTIIVYAADHGLALGSHGLLGKQSIYEHSMKCPLIIAGPAVPQAREVRAFSYLLDIYPTLCEMTGIRPPKQLDGRSLVSTWSRPGGAVRKSCFLPFQGQMRSVNDGRWKLIVYPEVAVTQLFDLQTDPDEINNLAENPAHAATRVRLMELLRMEQILAGDDLPLTVARPKPPEIDLTGHARKPDQWQPAWIVEKYFGPGAQ